MALLPNIFRNLGPRKACDKQPGKQLLSWRLACDDPNGLLIRYFDPCRERYMIKEIRQEMEMQHCMDLSEVLKVASFSCFPIHFPVRQNTRFSVTISLNEKEALKHSFEIGRSDWFAVDLRSEMELAFSAAISLSILT